jgi:ferredoxin
MTLKEFIETYDKPGSVVLLEGKRKVREEDRDKCIALGKCLAARTKYMIFRSGNAAGADELFAIGIASVDRTRMQVITPYSGHRKKKNVAYNTVSLDTINLAAEPKVVYEAKKNKKVERLIDQYVTGSRDRNAMKGAYILRDTVKVVGAENIPPATFAIFYDDPDHPMSGGTGHTMNVCRENGVPFIDQRVWFEWVKE